MRYTVNPHSMIMPWPSDDVFKECILFNNTSYRALVSVDHPFIVECENKPRDMIVYGIRWEELPTSETVVTSGSSNDDNDMIVIDPSETQIRTVCCGCGLKHIINIDVRKDGKIEFLMYPEEEHEEANI